MTAAGRVALVADGAVGALRVVSVRLGLAGARVALAGTTEGSAAAAYLSRDLTGAGVLALPYAVAPGRAADCARLLAEVRADLGTPDLLVDATGQRTLVEAVAHEMGEAGRGGWIALVGEGPLLPGELTRRWAAAGVRVARPAGSPRFADPTLAGAVLRLLQT